MNSCGHGQCRLPHLGAELEQDEEGLRLEAVRQDLQEVGMRQLAVGAQLVQEIHLFRGRGVLPQHLDRHRCLAAVQGVGSHRGRVRRLPLRVVAEDARCSTLQHLHKHQQTISQTLCFCSVHLCMLMFTNKAAVSQRNEGHLHDRTILCQSP